jgi:cysteine-rich repeat protein
LFLLAAIGLAGLSAGCSDDDGGTGPFCGNGIVEAGEACDDGAANSDTTPGACRTDCSDPGCGDNVVDPSLGEQCDDGNTVDGDGCDSLCRDEGTDPICGDGFVEGDEECDDGNNVNGDGCSAECMSEFCGDGVVQEGEECDDGAANSDMTPDACRLDCVEPYCGDGVDDTGEECDDGNEESGDGCTPDCIFESGVCGNGVKDPGEQCDDGNTSNGDGCDSSCQLEPGDCGNGVLEAGEECDDGNTVAGDGCDENCMREGAVCGNGVVETGEECDDGNTDSGDGCSAGCMIEGPVCGNGQVESGEECDDGNTVSGDGCSDTCQVETVPGCGNGTVDPGEECDDGNTTSGDGCSAICTNEVCGNGIVDVGEECDDGNTTDGDGCSSTCTAEQVTVCQPAADISCGQTKSYSTVQAGSTNQLNGYSCVSWNESGREYAYIFTAPSDSNIEVSLSGMTSDLDIFVIEDTGGVCDISSCLDFGDQSVEFQAVAGTTYYFIVDGYNGAEGPFSINVTCGACGDGLVDLDEECDDGNLQDGDGCSSECLLEECGNGTLDVGEECDDGNSTDCDGCSASCKLEECGNGRVECDEECDDGNTTDGDGCSSTCTFEGGTCTPEWDLTCGDEDRWATTNFGATDVVDNYSCVSWSETGPEYTYSYVAPQTGEVTVALSDLDTGVDLDIFVLSSDGGVCDSANCLAYGSLSATFDAVEGETYYLVVDGYLDDEGSYTINVDCAGGTCGDGVVNVGEECDDGNMADGDGCSSTCAEEYCGDGTVQAGLGEECDDGNTANGDGCSSTCQQESNDCVADGYLQCGTIIDGNNGQAGSTNNISDYSSCSQTSESGPEYTYWFYAYESATVTLDLTINTSGQDLDVMVLEESGNACGPGEICVASSATYGDESFTFEVTEGTYYYVVVDGYAGDEADYTISVSCDTGDYECANGDLEPGEQCDDGNTTDNDGCSATCTLEGGTCNPLYTLQCGDTDAWTTEYYDNNVEWYGCYVLSETGPEYTYSFTPSQTGDVTVSLSGLDQDLDIFVLVNPYGSCKPGNCVASGTSGTSPEEVTFYGVAGRTYYIVVEGYNGAMGSYDLSLTCQ